MLAFIVRRVLLGLLVVFGVLLVTFVMARVVPSDPARLYAGERATPEQVEKVTEELGLNDPLYVQFKDYMSGILQGDLGVSLSTKRPVADDIRQYLPATLELVFVAELFALAIGLPLGILAASKKDHLLDHASRLMAVGGAATPVFWSALVALLVFYYYLGWLPPGGMMSDMTTLLYPVETVTGFPLLDAVITGNWVAVKDQLWHLLLPSIVLAAGSISSVMRLTRTSMIEILHEDYITAARSYGLPERTVLWRFALKNSMGPTATVVALLTAYLIVNTFLVESLFSWPGIGRYISVATVALDFPVILGVAIVAAVSFVVLNTIADLVVALDPRVRTK